MKKVSLILIGLLTLALFVKAQPTQITSVNFESGIPSGWTVSSSSNEQAISAIASTGTKCARLTNGASVVTLTAPVFTRDAGCNVRLEFSHIPMLKNPSGEGSVEISTNNGATWSLLNIAGTASAPTGYDYTYGGGVGSSWDGYFKKIDYWDGNTNVPESSLDSSYWKNEIFYLTNALGSATSFQIRFKLAATTVANTFSGWYIDDIRLYQATQVGNTVRVPQLYSLDEYPSIYNYPNCADIPVAAQIRFRQSSASSVADSIYIEYKVGASDSVMRSTMAYSSTSSSYIGSIPFYGFDTVTKWRLVINDEKFNRLTYPYVYGHWNSFKNVRPYHGQIPMSTSGLSSQEVMMKTNMIRNLYQFRYTAAELQALGISAGKVGGLMYNVTQATSGFVMQGFKVFMANIPSSTVLSTTTQYTGTYQTVIANATIPAPTVGWHELVFDNNFIWDGSSDILIKVCWDNGASASAGGTTKIQCVSASGNSITHQYFSSSGYTVACNNTFNPSDPTFGYRPNFKFDFIDDCHLAQDVGSKDSLFTPSSLVVNSGVSVPITTKIHNYGTGAIHTVQVSYSVKNGATVPAPVITGNWTGTVNPNSDVVYAIPTVKQPTFTFGYNYMKIWSDLLPPDVDWEPLNDTAYFEVVACTGGLSGIYSIGTVNGVTADRRFNNFNEVFKMLKGCGVSGPVTFKVANLPSGQYYNDTLVFPANITGVSATNYIKFVSASSTPIAIRPNGVVNSNINLSGCKYIKFENVSFYRAANQVNYDSLGVTYSYAGDANIIQMSNATSNIEFKKCNFYSYDYTDNTDTSSVYPQHIINVGGANYITIDSCLFNGTASNYDIYIKGSSTTNTAQGNSIKNSSFRNNIWSGAIYMEYTKNSSIKKNTFVNNLNNTVSAAIYNILVQNSYEFSLEK